MFSFFRKNKGVNFKIRVNYEYKSVVQNFKPQPKYSSHEELMYQAKKLAVIEVLKLIEKKQITFNQE
jgi:hypothetical protein